MTELLFKCPECGGEVHNVSGGGRTLEYRRGAPPMPVPEDFAIPTCMSCGETYEDPDTETQLTAHLESAFRSWLAGELESIVTSLTFCHNATRREIAATAGVTPSHLSHLLAGTATASLTLQRLLEAYALDPDIFRRHRQGIVFSKDALHVPWQSVRELRYEGEQRLADQPQYVWSSMDCPTQPNGSAVAEVPNGGAVAEPV